MSVFKEINKADGSGVTQFFRLSTEKQTVETNDYGDFYNFKGGVASRKDLPTTKLETGDAYFIEDEEKTVFWDGTEWREINAYVLNYNYNDASNKPLINGHVLSGDKSAAELELQPAGDYLTEIPEEYITEKELEDLDLADKNYVIDQINNTEHFHREIVDGLPVIGKDNVIYMVKKKSTSGDDIYDEWMWVDTKYEHIGSTATDLSDYYKKEEADKLLDKKVDKVTGKGLSTNDYTTAEKTKLASLENYDDTQIKAELATLHNYDDTDIKNDITALKTAENGLKTDVNDIKEELKDKIEGVRLVRSGDMWDFYTVGGTRLTYEAARELLGHPNTILYMEGVENDGKTTPADYDIDEELIHVHYMDEDGEDRYLQMGYPNTASVEGSYIHIEDAVAQPLNSLTIEGVTEQKTYTGKNLFDLYMINKPGDQRTEYGITITYGDNGIITLNGTASSNGDINLANHNYTINLTEDIYLCFEKISGSSTLDRGLGCEAITPDGTSLWTYNANNTTPLVKVPAASISKIRWLRIPIIKDMVLSNYKIRVWVSKSNDLIYEPYTNGLPAPSLDYPVSCINLQKSNIIIANQQLYDVNDTYDFTTGVKLSEDWVRVNYDNTQGTKTIYANNYSNLSNLIEPSNDYTVILEIKKCEFSINEGNMYSSIRLGNTWYNSVNTQFKETYVLSLKDIHKNIYAFNFTSRDNYDYSFMMMRNFVDVVPGDKIDFIYRISVYKRTDFVLDNFKYKSFGRTSKITEIPLNSDREGTTRDRIEIIDNSAKMVKTMKKLILDGENYKIIGKHNSIKTDSKGFFQVLLPNKKKNLPSGSTYCYYCDYLLPCSGMAQSAFDSNDLGMWWEGGANSSYIYLILPFTSTEEANSYLQTTPFTFLYELEEPETIDLGEIDMPATFEGVNNITVDSDLNPNIKINYVTNVNYLDKNIGFKNHYIGYYEDAANLPTGNKGDIATVSSDKRIYINDGNEWIPSDKNSTVDLTNYLAKDNTTGYTPTDNYNPATKKYVDDSIKNINIPTKTSQLTNDSNFVIKTTNELTNYYTKNNTYTKSEVNALVSGSGGSTEATWGSITGTLNDQTDLKEALAAKADTTALPNMSNYATKTYADNCKLENVSANEGNMIFGPTYDETSYGGQLTSLSPSTITNIKIGQVYEWINPTGSGMGADVNYAVVTGILQQSGTNYTTRTIYMGNQMSYVYAYDSTKVYKGSYGG